ncbi:MAG: hypothetical protein V2A73_20360 [Pseudomonadota bacterium]
MAIFGDRELVCDRFAIERFLERGAVGEGYLCTDRLLRDHKVVCKVALQTDEDAWREFREQYLKLLRIRSSGVAQVLGLHEHRGGSPRAVIALEWIDGQNLMKWAKTQGLRSRLEALVQIASALAALHKEGIAHGDLWGGVNVVAGSSRGCVLIDPQPDLWGTTSGSSERRGDIESLAPLIEGLAPEYAPGVLASLIKALRAPPPETAIAALAEVQLRAVAREAPMIDGSCETVKAAGNAYQERTRRINAKYRENRQVRSIAIGGLAERIALLAADFGLEFSFPGINENAEAQRDEVGQGFFFGRVLECSPPSEPDRRWRIVFDDVRDFGKPWPYKDGRTIAAGTWRVDGSRQRAGTISLSVDEDGVPVFMVAPNPKRESIPPEKRDEQHLDNKWLHRCLADLTGSQLLDPNTPKRP